MPTVEVAVAETEMVPVATVAFVGESNVVPMPVVLTVRVTGIVCGEPVAPDAVIVAVAL
jgi:hypothetical protein